MSVYNLIMIIAILFATPFNFRPYAFFIAMLVLAVMGWANGYATARVLKYFGSVDWLFSALISAIIFPAWLLVTLGIIDTIE